MMVVHLFLRAVSINVIQMLQMLFKLKNSPMFASTSDVASYSAFKDKWKHDV